MSERKQVLLHAGLPKTGTTYLQRCFADNADWLRSRGVAYPTLGREHLYGQHNLSRYLNGEPLVNADFRGRSPVEVFRAALQAEVGRVLISCERLATLTDAGSAQLGEALEGHDVSVVVYLRRRSAVCVSMWSELVKHGLLASFEEFLAGELLGTSAWVLRPEVVLRKVHAMVGGERMTVVLYDHLVEDGVELSGHFCEAQLGLEVDTSYALPDRAFNRSDDRATLEVVRAVNEARARRGHAPDISEHLALSAFLRADPVGAQVIEQVRELTAARGEDLDLRRLDSEWLDQDRWLRAELGDRVLNPGAGEDLFRPRQEARVRVLRPARLYAAVPAQVFDDLAARLPAPLQPQG